MTSNDPIGELLSRFHNLPDSLDTDSLAERLMTSHDLRTPKKLLNQYHHKPRPALRGIIGDEYHQLAPLLSILTNATEKFDYRTTTGQQWRDFYTFPSRRSVAQSQKLTEFSAYKYTRRTFANTEDNYCNFVNEILSTDSEDTRRRIDYLLGKVGSGKSTFIKYFCNKELNRFRSERIIVSRVECRKIKFSLGQHGKHPTPEIVFDRISRTIKRNLVRDILWQLTHQRNEETWERESISPNDNELFNDSAFLEFGHEQLEILKENGNIEAANISWDARDAYVSRILKLMKSYRNVNWETKKRLVSDLSEVACEIIIRYFSLNNFRFLVIFDGFDYLTAADRYLDDAWNPLLLKSASELIYNWERANFFEYFRGSIKVNFLILLRETTFPGFTRNHSIATGQIHQPRTYSIIPPSEVDIFNTIVERIESYIKPSSSQSTATIGLELRDFQDTFCNQIMESLKLPLDYRLIDIFNGNLRLQLRYLGHVIDMQIDFFIRNGMEQGKRYALKNGKVTLVEFISLFTKYNFTELFKNHGYRFVELLLIVDQWYFSPFVERRDDSNAIDDSDILSGYIDNAFNYTLDSYDTSNGLPNHGVLLIKLWIMDQLSIQALTLDDLKERSKSFTSLRDHEWERLIAVMVRTNLIGDRIDNGRHTYFIEIQGDYLRRVLVFQMEYLEHVIHSTLIPTPLAEIILGEVKYGWPTRAITQSGSLKSPDVHYRNDGINQSWPFIAIVNCYLFLRYVNYIFLLEREKNTSPTLSTTISHLLDKWRVSVSSSVEKICRADAELRSQENINEWWATRALLYFSSLKL